jgi:chromate transporter
MLLPGPEAQQLAIYIGWLLHRTIGGIIAGAFFVIPSIFILLVLSYIYAAYGNIPTVAGVLAGFKPVVVAIVVEAILKIGSRALKRWAHFVIAAAAFIAIYFFHVPFPLIVLAAAIVGFIGSKQTFCGLCLQGAGRIALHNFEVTHAKCISVLARRIYRAAGLE